jgi:hypothetical protein
MTQAVRTAFRAAGAHALVLVVAACGSAPARVPAPAADVGCDGSGGPTTPDTVVVGVPPDGAGHVAAGCPGIVLDLRQADADQRNQLDVGADVVVTRDPATIAYAEGRAGFTSVPLGWDRTYLLVVPGRPATWLADTSAEFRRRLARDAVSASARGAEGPFWWEESQPRCERPLATRFADSTVTYHESDRTARELAERLVALAGTQGIRLRAVARPPGAASVIPIPRSVLADGCEYGLTDATIIPLVDTRATAILRQGRVRIATGQDGGLRILPADSVASPR